MQKFNVKKTAALALFQGIIFSLGAHSSFAQEQAQTALQTLLENEANTATLESQKEGRKLKTLPLESAASAKLKSNPRLYVAGCKTTHSVKPLGEVLSDEEALAKINQMKLGGEIPIAYSLEEIQEVTASLPDPGTSEFKAWQNQMITLQEALHKQGKTMHHVVAAGNAFQNGEIIVPSDLIMFLRNTIKLPPTIKEMQVTQLNDLPPSNYPGKVFSNGKLVTTYEIANWNTPADAAPATPTRYKASGVYATLACAHAPRVAGDTLKFMMFEWYGKLPKAGETELQTATSGTDDMYSALAPLASDDAKSLYYPLFNGLSTIEKDPTIQSMIKKIKADSRLGSEGEGCAVMMKVKLKRWEGELYSRSNLGFDSSLTLMGTHDEAARSSVLESVQLESSHNKMIPSDSPLNLQRDKNAILNGLKYLLDQVHKNKISCIHSLDVEEVILDATTQN